jgi:type IV pilus assembly protein PilY1
MLHCAKSGYIVVFGTGRWLGDTDRNNTDTQSIFGVWDYGDDSDDGEYLGTFDRSAVIGNNQMLSNLPNYIGLIEQTEIDWRYVNSRYLRTLSNNAPNWEIIADSADTNGSQTGSADELANPGSTGCQGGGGSCDDIHVGWFFDVPGTLSATDQVGERIVKDVLIRDGKAVVISMTPSDSPCTGGSTSIVHEMDACAGTRLAAAQFDIDDDHDIDDSDRINIDIDDPDNPGTTITVPLPPTGQSFSGSLHPPSFLRMPDNKRERKIFSTSAGTTVSMDENAEKRGIMFWQER